MNDEKQLRYSRQREMIYNYLLSTKAHPSAEMIYEDLRKYAPDLSLGTVYRNLKLLESINKVRKIANHHDHDRYDACVIDHAHFLCEKCGKVDDIDDAQTDQIRANLSLNDGYTLSSLSLTLSGLCPICNNKKA